MASRTDRDRSRLSFLESSFGRLTCRSSNFQISVGDSFSYGTWIYVDDNDCQNNYLYSPVNIDNGSPPSSLFYLTLNKEDDIRFISLSWKKEYADTSVSFINPENMDNNSWNYIGVIYNSITDIIYLTVNETVMNSGVLGGSWPDSVPDFSFKLNVCNLWETYNCILSIYLDETIFIEEAIDPIIFVNHYIHNAAWGDYYVPQ